MAGIADLYGFTAVARARSFGGADMLRGVSASGYSEAVRRLDTRLGVRLLNRTSRSVTPTEAGERLLERLCPALGEVAAALDAAASFRDTPSGGLKLNVPFLRRPRHPAADRQRLSQNPSWRDRRSPPCKTLISMFPPRASTPAFAMKTGASAT
jgi:DNA-binding transcriptional LysR family regulator